MIARTPGVRVAVVLGLLIFCSDALAQFKFPIPKIPINIPGVNPRQEENQDNRQPATPTKPPPATIPEAERELQNAKPKDKVMWQYVLGSMKLRAGRYAEAQELFEDACNRVDNRYGKDRNAARARTLFANEDKKVFIGEPYERAMANYYLGILRWISGDVNGAIPCFKNAQWEDTFPEGTNSYYADYAILDYLRGLGLTRLGVDPGSALADARSVTNNITVGSLSPPPMPNYNPRANVLVIAEYGRGPLKYAEGRNKELLKFHALEVTTTAARVTIGGNTCVLLPFDDVVFQAMTRGGRVMDSVNKRKAVFKDGTAVVGAAALVSAGALAAAKVDQNVALAVMAVGLAAEVMHVLTKTETDTRMWYNLPQFLSAASLELPPGSYDGQVEFVDTDQKVLEGRTRKIQFTVSEDPKKDTVVFVSELTF